MIPRIYQNAQIYETFRNEDQVKIVHFIGKQKPWMITYSQKGAGEYYVNKYTQQWTDVYNRVIRQQLPPNLVNTTH